MTMGSKLQTFRGADSPRFRSVNLEFMCSWHINTSNRNVAEMLHRSKSRESASSPAFPRRFVALYLILLAIPAANLLLHPLSGLTGTRKPATGAAELAATLEQRTAEIVQASFSDGELNPDTLIGLRPTRAEDRGIFRSVQTRLQRRHPIVKDIFVVRQGEVLFPPLIRPPVLSTASYVIQHEGERGGPLSRMLALAEAQQRTEQYGEAIATLSAAQNHALSGAVKALTMLRMAACFERMGLPSQADSTYAALSQRYGDEYDPSGLPYAVMAGLARSAEGPSELKRLYGELINGRWELSAEQFEQVRERFQARLGDSVPQEPTAYLEAMEMGRALQAAVRPELLAKAIPLTNGKAPGLVPFAFAGPEHNYQSYLKKVVAGDGQTVLLGISIDLDWLQQVVCPEIGLGNKFDLAYAHRVRASSAGTSFPTAFPFWELRPTTAAAQQHARHISTMMAMSTEVLAATLCLGLFVVHRHLAREREMNRLRSNFISGVSHELKTPITLVRLYSETLSGCPELQPESREYCEIINKEAQRLTKLVEGVLDFSAIERGTKTYCLQPDDLGALAGQTLAHLRRYFYYKGFTLSEDISLDLPPVRLDPEAVKSALVNLLDNAVKYASSAPTVRVFVYRKDGTVVIAVEDNGIGIAPGMIDKIFEPFFRVHYSAQGGCGLGLYLVRDIMTAHGGTVNVKSDVGVGSRFELVFPIAPSVESASEETTAGPEHVPAMSA
jgi:signal transduction histidine kinase